MLYNTSQSIALSVAVLITALSIQLTECWAQVGSIFPKPLEFFSTDEELILLNTFEYYSSKASVNILQRETKRIGFCCSADLDVAVPAIEFMLALNTSTSKAVYHQHIDSLEHFQESFAHYLNLGAAAEQSTLKLETFQKVIAIAEQLKSVKQDVGGNAATMANRAAIEGSSVLLGAAMGQKMRQYFNNDVKLAGHLDDDSREDTHLVLEYSTGDQWHGHVAPRANRYYLNHDIENAQLGALEEFETALESFKPDLIVIGGLQLMEVDLNETRRLLRLGELSSVLQNMYVQSVPTHFEFAAASDFNLYRNIVDLVLPWVNSVGLNEQELHTLHHYLKDGDHSVSSPSQPSVEYVAKEISEIIDIATRARQNTAANMALARLNRIHFHTLQFHMLCQRTTDPIWGDSTDAIVQGALVTSKIACGDKSKGNRIRDMTLNSEDLKVLLPRKVVVGRPGLSEIVLDPRSPVQSWTENGFKCSIIPMLVCKKADHTAGLGDNISGAGAAYHIL